MINVNQITAMLAKLGDHQLKQYAAMHKDDPYIMSLAVTEANRRKALRADAQAEGEDPPQTDVVDQELAEMAPAPAPAMAPMQPMLPEEQGIARLPAGDMNFAGGGIVAFAGGGTPDDKIGTFKDQYGPVAAQVGAQIGVDPNIILAQWALETDYGRKTVGANNLGNIKDFSGKGPRALDKAEGSNDAYRTYDTPDAFGTDFAGLISRRYPKAVGAGADVAKYAAGLEGYATDKDYGKKLSSVLTKLMPIGTANATEAVPQTPAGQIPGVMPRAPYVEPKKSLMDYVTAPVQTVYSLAHNTFAIPASGAVAGISTLLGKPRSMDDVYRQMVYVPGNPVSQDQLETISDAAKALKIPAYMPAPSPVINIPSKTAAADAAAIAKASNLRLGAGTAEQMANLATDQAAAATAAQRAAQAATTAQRVQAANSGLAAAANAANASSLAATSARAGTAPTAPNSTPAFTSSFNWGMDRNQDTGLVLSKDEEKMIADAAKDATPPSKRKGFTPEDWLQLGLGMMATKSSNFLQGVGEAGIGALKARSARIKDERDEENDAIKNDYNKAMAEYQRALAKALESNNPKLAALAEKTRGAIEAEALKAYPYSHQAADRQAFVQAKLAEALKMNPALAQYVGAGGPSAAAPGAAPSFKFNSATGQLEPMR